MELVYKKIFLQVVSEFVKTLNGRYSKYTSDDFLAQVLTKMVIQCEDSQGEEIEEDDYYEIGATVFEQILELELGAGGNGHHVAQDFARFMIFEINKKEDPSQ